MCGIIGYIGERPALPILLAGLRRLEYLGYDSVGLCITTSDAFATHKVAGRLSGLEELLEGAGPLEGTYGIAHTRWATHGAPTTRNAHPHVDCGGNIAVVHNGIIEN